MSQDRQLEFTTEQVSYWFFRLNGCLNLANFLIHHEESGKTGTEIDLLGVRFPYRSEMALYHEPMEDHRVFRGSGNRIDIIFAEVKIGRCRINQSWQRPDVRNMERILYALGAFPTSQVDRVAEALYRQHRYEDKAYRVRIFAVGREENNSLPDKIVQLTWHDMLEFIYRRFKKYRDPKADHSQWDPLGHFLFDQMDEHDRAGNFVQRVMQSWNG